MRYPTHACNKYGKWGVDKGGDFPGLVDVGGDLHGAGGADEGGDLHGFFYEGRDLYGVVDEGGDLHGVVDEGGDLHGVVDEGREEVIWYTQKHLHLCDCCYILLSELLLCLL